ncbi:hypothetical protein M8J75_008637 [Diaphorina citri]|nr:hypothetical protein M8J75_008637 [Diaphorina citri]
MNYHNPEDIHQKFMKKSEDPCSSSDVQSKSHGEESVDAKLFCDYCNDAFTERKILQLHIRIMHSVINGYVRKGLQWYTCRDCPEKLFNQPNRITDHMRLWHDKIDINPEDYIVKTLQDIKYACKVCSKPCYRSATCDLHPMKDTNECDQHFDHHTCSECGSKHNDCQSLWSHVFLEHSNTFVRWVWYCCHCSKYFDNSSKLVSHTRVEHASEKEICSVCDVAFSVHVRDITKPTETNIKVEIVEIGEDDDNYDCYNDTDDNIVEFSTSDLQSIEEKDMDIFICNFCCVYFTSKNLLKLHIKRSHIHMYDFVELYECDICLGPKSYIRGQDIRKHMRARHNEEVSDISRFRRKTNVQEVNLELNKANTSVMNNVYECRPCDKSYARKQDIFKHMRNVHNKHIVNPNHYKKKLILDFPEYTTKTREIFKCEICEKHHLTAESLTNHMSTTHEKIVNSNDLVVQIEQIFGCTLCDTDYFSSLEELKIHCQDEHNFSSHIYLCPQCNHHFFYSSNMMKHLKEMHANLNWTTRDLLKTIVSKGNDKVSRLQTGALVYTCNFCPKKFKVQAYIESHLETTHNTNKKEYTLSKVKLVDRVRKESNIESLICDQCNQTFSNRSSLAHHIEEHMAVNWSSLECQHCKELFDNMNAMWSHMFTMHATSTHQCSLCLVSLDRKRDVVKHMAEHHGIILLVEDTLGIGALKEKCRIYVNGALRYQCQECTAILHSFSTLKTHMYTHTGEKPIVCDQCSKQFRTVSQLKVHIVSVHDNVRKYGCEYCGHAFACSSNLAQHIRIHTGEKPYVCELCGNRYAQSASLYSHKLTHAQDRCHVCTECGRAFHRITRLNQHLKLHTGNRPPRSHLCDICHKGFRTNSEMKRHQQIHNPVRSYICETCGSAFTIRKYLLQHYKIHRDLPQDTTGHEQHVNIETITDIDYAA